MAFQVDGFQPTGFMTGRAVTGVGQIPTAEAFGQARLNSHNPLFRSSAVALVNNASSAVVTKPAGATNGDLLILLLIQDQARSATSGLSGWTQGAPSFVTTTDGLTVGGWLYRIASGEPASYTITFSGAFSGQILLLAYQRVDQRVPIDPASSLTADTANTLIPQTSTVTPAVNGCTILALYGERGVNATPVTPDAATVAIERYEANYFAPATSRNITVYAEDVVQDTAAAVTETCTVTTPGQFVKAIIAIRSASGVITPAGIASAQAVGQPRVGSVSQLTLYPEGINQHQSMLAGLAALMGSVEEMGRPDLEPPGSFTTVVDPIGDIVTAEQVGQPTIGGGVGFQVVLEGNGIPSAEAFGSLTINRVYAQGIDSAEAFGTPVFLGFAGPADIGVSSDLTLDTALLFDLRIVESAPMNATTDGNDLYLVGTDDSRGGAPALVVLRSGPFGNPPQAQ